MHPVQLNTPNTTKPQDIKGIFKGRWAGKVPARRLAFQRRGVESLAFQIF